MRSSLLFLFSCPVCHSARAAPSLHLHAGGGGGAPRAGTRRTQRATRRARGCWQSQRGALSEFWVSLLSSPCSARTAPSLRRGRACSAASGRAPHAACDARGAPGALGVRALRAHSSSRPVFVFRVLGVRSVVVLLPRCCCAVSRVAPCAPPRERAQCERTRLGTAGEGVLVCAQRVGGAIYIVSHRVDIRCECV